MSRTKHSGPKAPTEEIVLLNCLGLSTRTIAKILDCHHTTVTHRLESIGQKPADTRRAFMEDIIAKMNHDQQQWLADQIGPHMPIKEYVRGLLLQEYAAAMTKAASTKHAA